ncbi:MAG: outer membrane protein [Candidatus Arsenophonus phytopathogenicus]
MRKTLLVLLTTSLIPSTLLANESKSGMYVTGKMGASIMQMSGQFYPFSSFATKIRDRIEGETHRTAVFGIGLALGYDFYDNFNLPIRTELDFTSRKNTKYSYSKVDRSSPNSTKITINNQIDLNTLMFNAYYDFKNSSDLTPYLSAGLGYAYISQKTSPHIRLKTIQGILWKRSHATNNFA